MISDLKSGRLNVIVTKPPSEDHVKVSTPYTRQASMMRLASLPSLPDKSSDKVLQPLSSYVEMIHEALLYFQVLSEVGTCQGLLFLYGHHRWQD